MQCGSGWSLAVFVGKKKFVKHGMILAQMFFPEAEWCLVQEIRVNSLVYFGFELIFFLTATVTHWNAGVNLAQCRMASSGFQQSLVY